MYYFWPDPDGKGSPTLTTKSQTASLDKNLAAAYEEALVLAIREDLGSYEDRIDLTTDAIVEPGVLCKAHVLLKEPGVLAGSEVARDVFSRFSNQIKVEIKEKDGTYIDAIDLKNPPRVILLEGPAEAILKAERLVLNLMQRMSGVATITKKFVDKAGSRVKVLDTRKTTPCLRAFDRLAVQAAGGTNHRSGLYDQVLIKDNHIVMAGSIEKAISLVRAKNPDVIIEVETRTIEEVKEAACLEPHIIMLDNMSPEMVKEAIGIVNGKSQIEISGGINLDTIGTYLLDGVDAISVGALTHSAPSLDISLDIYELLQPH